MGKAKSSPKYRMTISRMTIDKLGIKLYDKVSAVLAELIANSYDADATEVTIMLPVGTYLATKSKGVVTDQGYEIKITDNGHGMTPDDINPHYLKVGIDRRQRPQGDLSREKGRPVMGRKGIGKLAPFGICSEIEVLTAGGPPEATEYRVSHLILRYDDIITEADEEYNPEVGPCDGAATNARGTTVTLRGFARRKVPGAETLHRQLAARFGLARADWKVTVVNSTQEGESFELAGESLDVTTLDGTRVDLNDRPVMLEDGTELPVRGWVAYAKEAYKDEVMAGVRVYARGKIVSRIRDFNIPSGFTGEYKMRSYLVGYVEADWIDGAEDDLIRSDRQDIIWNSEKGEAFQRWGQNLLRELAAKAETSVKSKVWDEFAAKSAIEDRARRAFPNDRDFQGRVKEVARLAIRGASRDAIKDQDYVDHVVEFALSVAPHRVLLDTLQEISSDTTKTLDTVVSLFAKVRMAELYSLGQVARERIASVNELEDLISTATTEGPLQQLLEGAPWLVYPDWTPISMDRPLAEFRRAFEEWYKRVKKEDICTSAILRGSKEPDFVFISDNRRMEIVEIKRPGTSFSNDEFDRAYGYLAAVREFCRENPEIAGSFSEPQLLIICNRIGCTNPAYRRIIENDPQVHHTLWRTVLHRTRQAHGDFLEAMEKMEVIATAGAQDNNVGNKAEGSDK